MLRKRVLAAAAGAVSIGLAGCGSTDHRSVQTQATTGSIGPVAAYAPPASAPRPVTAPTKEWSGTSGASGHPQMTAQAIRRAAADFPRCVERMWPQAARRGVSRATFTRHTAGLTPDLRIMDLMDAQPEFTKAIWDYLDLLVSEARIARGREMLAAHRAQFDAVEKAYQVDRQVIAAIWGVETSYGAISGDRPVIRSTATLACIGRRQDYFRQEFLATLEILERGDVHADRLKGSWAGAFGSTQFMPTTFVRSAIDFDRDGRRDVVGSVPDILASTANKLKKNGWRYGQPWGYEVVLPRGFDYMLADKERTLPVAEWERRGVARPGGKAFAHRGEQAFLMAPAGARGPAFLMLENFSVIMKYNPAEAYALAIGHLGDRLRGGEPFAQNWPRGEAVLSRQERFELQQRLARRGFDIGEPDGRLGDKTRVAIRNYQASVGLTPDGFPSGTILSRLRSQ